MGYRIVKGRLAADPEQQAAGSITITKFRVLENTGEYRKGEWHQHEAPTGHDVEAKFELGDLAAATLAKGVAVIVEGSEHTESWEHEGKRYQRRVLDATAIAPRLVKGQTVSVNREGSSESAPEVADASWAAPAE